MSKGRLIPLFCILVSLLWSQDSATIVRYQAARQLQQEGRYFAAIEEYTDLVLAFPDYAEPILALAESYFMIGEYGDALDYALRAKRLRRGDTAVEVLHARILVGSGAYDEARELFNDILSREPNNVEARLGLAELDVAIGQVGDAVRNYTELLERIPNDRRALLGLLLLSDELERFEASEMYVSAAVRYHGNTPAVQVAVAHHYMRIRRFEDALYHARLAVSLDPNYHPALIAEANARLSLLDYDGAVDTLAAALRVLPDDPDTLYALGTAYALAGRNEEALRSYTAVFRRRRDDELTRFALERLVKAETAMDHPLRVSLGDYHLDRGREFEERFLLTKALREYRLAVQLIPSNTTYRREYAEVFNTLGYPAKYLSELEVIAAEGETDVEISDELEIQRSLQESGIARNWGIEQFALQREEFNLGIYLISGSSRMTHFAGDGVAADLFVNLLQAGERVRINTGGVRRVSSYAEAFRLSRTSGEDYFGLVSFDETERTFSMRLDFHLSANGKRLRRFHTFRTGNDRVVESLAKTSDDLRSSLPLKGRLIDREFDQGLIGLGRFDGIEAEDEFLIIRKGEAGLKRESIGFEYDEPAVVGRFVVESADELVAEGRIIKDGFFDYVNEGDLIIHPEQEVDPQNGGEEAKRSLYQELITIQ